LVSNRYPGCVSHVDSIVIVPDAQPGDEPTIEIDDVRQNVAFASVVEGDSRTL
jgi:predicted RNA-binding protein with TRAM domain